jgi:hypothetical protein
VLKIEATETRTHQQRHRQASPDGQTSSISRTSTPGWVGPVGLEPTTLGLTEAGLRSLWPLPATLAPTASPSSPTSGPWLTSFHATNHATLAACRPGFMRLLLGSLRCEHTQLRRRFMAASNQARSGSSQERVRVWLLGGLAMYLSDSAGVATGS